MLPSLFSSLCLAAIAWWPEGASALTAIKSERPIPIRQSALNLKSPHDRRAFLVRQITVPTIAVVAATSLPTPHPALADTIWLTDKGRPDVPPFTGGADAGKARFQLAIRDVDILLDNYDALARSGGDTVRLYLGTQGVKSNMFGIMKVLKSLKEEADDIVEYTEAMDEFEIYLFQAEGAAYQSMFVEHSSAKGTPESVLKTARGDVVNMRKFMSLLATQLNVVEPTVANDDTFATEVRQEIRGRSRGT